LLSAQQTGATISGAVTDTAGAAVQDLEVLAVQAETAARTLVRTNESGFFSLRPLPIGE